jgi:tripartite-type tricarboxylate transporter receptor subunit TctC
MILKIGIAAVVLALSALAPAWAQSFPNQTIKIVVAYAPGGTGDIVARLIATKMQAALGQNVVVENRPGATGVIGTQSVVAAPADGHTLLLGQTGEIAINQHWIANITYDAQKDLLPVALASVVPLALVVPSKAPYGTMAELAKALSGGQALTFASAGIGTPGHFAGEFLKLRAKANLTHVPYKGAGPALNDLVGGHVDMYFPGFPAAAPHLKSGTLKVLAVSSSQRTAAAPEVPTVAEVIKDPNFDLTLWQGFFVPRNTPKDIAEKLNVEINKILAQPEVKAKLLEAGADVRSGSVEQFAAFTRSESEKYLQIIKESGVKPE